MIPIYNDEIKLGLSDLIKSSGKIIYSSLIQPCELPKNFDLSRLDLNKSIASATIEDLYPIKDILVSTGMNLNDDVFDPIEVWKARKTPENKPFNEGHDSSRVRGHIIQSVAVSADFASAIDENTAIEDLPLHFHLLNHSVLYKFLKTDLEEHMAKIIAEIQEDKWFVSQECLFKDFDYALANEEGVQKIISRNKETAFLSKYLRAFNGSGEYQGQRIGRLARNITFCGKGLVAKPANPKSIIFSEIKPIKNNLVYFTVMTAQNKEEKRIMTDNVDITKLVKELADSKEAQSKLAAELAKVQSDKQSLADQIKNADLQSYKDKIAAFEKAVSEKDEQLKKVTEQLTQSAQVQVDLNKKVETLTAELTSAKVELDKIAAEKKNAERAEKLVSLNKVKDKAAAQTIVSSLTVLNDEAFEKFVAGLAETKVDNANPLADAEPQGNKAPNVPNEPENSVASLKAEALGLLLANIKNIKEKK